MVQNWKYGTSCNGAMPGVSMTINLFAISGYNPENWNKKETPKWIKLIKFWKGLDEK